MTNSYDVDHGLSQCHPGPLEPVEIAKQDDTLARTGNTARDQEMYAAGIEVGEANTKHNAAIRAGVPDGWKLLAKKTCYVLMHDGAVIATLAGPESEANAAIIARMLAAPGVSTVEDPSFPTGAIVNGRTLADRLEAYPFESQGGDLRLCSDWVEFRRCFEYLAEWVGSRAPAAGDALDAARYRLAVADCILVLRGDAALGRDEWDSKLDALAKTQGAK